jgi:hypothetical protein
MRTTIRMLFLVLALLAFGRATGAGATDLPADINYNQCDARWRDDAMGMPGVCPETICSAGAYMTCVAMLLSWVAGGPDAPDPGALNTWLQANGGYMGCIIVSGVADNYDGTGSGLEWIDTLGLSFDDWASLDAELAAGDRMPLVSVYSGGHWVIVHDRVGPSGVPSSYRVLDPLQPYSATRTLAAYTSGGRTIFGLARFSGRFPVGALTDAGGAGSPSPCRVLRASPNPFNPRTTIRFDLPDAGQARLAVYDVAGRLVKVLVEGETLAGSHEAVWDGRDASGRAVPSGSYLARLVAGGKVEGVRLSLVR